MNCEELITYLSDYIEQDLNAELLAVAREHLATCQNCRVVVDTTQKMIILYRASDKQRIPVGRRNDLFLRLQHSFNRSEP
jgi:predicted anti-sigma-YlaC factor YlaD